MERRPPRRVLIADAPTQQLGRSTVSAQLGRQCPPPGVVALPVTPVATLHDICEISIRLQGMT